LSGNPRAGGFQRDFGELSASYRYRRPACGQASWRGACQQIGENHMSKSLYERLGASEGIRRLVDDVVAAHLGNPIVKTRFESVKDMAHLKKKAHEFFCAGAGGPEAYTGKDMRVAHQGMNISEQEYLAVMDDIVGALDKNRLDEGTTKDVIAILYSLKGDIMRR
jgi:hemoglobin